MKRFFNKFTGGNPALMITPTIWAFLENLCSLVPAMLSMWAIGQLVTVFIPPYQLNAEGLWKCCLGMAGAAVLQGIVSILSYRFSYYASQQAMGEMRLSIMAKLKALPLGYYAGKKSGELANTFLTDPDKLDQAMSFYIPQVISMGVLSGISFIMLMITDWRLALPMYVALPICLILMGLAMRLRYRQAENVRKAKVNTKTLLNEYLLGMKNLKSYNQTGTGFTRLDKAYDKLREENTREEGLPGSLTLLASHIIHLGVPLMISVAAMLLLNGTVDIILVLMFFILATRLYSPLSTAILGVINLRACSVSAERIENLLGEQEQSGEMVEVAGTDISFNNITFAYGQDEVIRDVSFKVPEKGFTALVGPSGSGKSTLLRLACRFWDVSKGEICLGSIPVKQIHPSKLYEKVAMVFQDNYLFGDSIRNNLLFGQEHKTEAQMITACRKAKCHDFILELPQGYDTVIGEGGATLSGGERQRIAIARAILKDAPILLLDEPTSSLDAENEWLIQQAISELVQEKTVIMIAHRLKTIAVANQIIVLDQGRVVQQGVHQELLAEEGVYKHLWDLQHQARHWQIRN